MIKKTRGELYTKLADFIRYQDMRALADEMVKKYRVRSVEKLDLEQLEEWVEYCAARLSKQSSR